METNHKTLISNLMLILAAAIWGSNFVFQKIASTEIEPFFFMSIRSLLGSITLLIIYLIIKKHPDRNDEVLNKYFAYNHTEKLIYYKRLIKVALICGCINSTGSVFVQWGLLYTNASKAGFLNAIYIIIVPILGFLFFKTKSTLNMWVAVLIASVGLYYLCINNRMILSFGDAIILSSTFCFALHIQLLNKYIKNFVGIHLACIEFFFATIYCGLMSLLFESPSIDQVFICKYSILFAGILGIGLCYALQVTAQKNTNPTVAALLMSLESVFGALGGTIVLGETISGRELIGIIFISVSIILAQLPPKLLFHNRNCHTSK